MGGCLQNDIEPRFELGFGLSYTTFACFSCAVHTAHHADHTYAAPKPRHGAGQDERRERLTAEGPRVSRSFEVSFKVTTDRSQVEATGSRGTVQCVPASTLYSTPTPTPTPSAPPRSSTPSDARAYDPLPALPPSRPSRLKHRLRGFSDVLLALRPRLARPHAARCTPFRSGRCGAA